MNSPTTNNTVIPTDGEPTSHFSQSASTTNYKKSISLLQAARTQTGWETPSSSRKDPSPPTVQIQEWRRKTAAALETGYEHNRSPGCQTHCQYQLRSQQLRRWQRRHRCILRLGQCLVCDSLSGTVAADMVNTPGLRSVSMFDSRHYALATLPDYWNFDMKKLKTNIAQLAEKTSVHVRWYVLKEQ